MSNVLHLLAGTAIVTADLTTVYLLAKEVAILGVIMDLVFSRPVGSHQRYMTRHKGETGS